MDTFGDIKMNKKLRIYAYDIVKEKKIEIDKDDWIYFIFQDGKREKKFRITFSDDGEGIVINGDYAGMNQMFILPKVSNSVIIKIKELLKWI